MKVSTIFELWKQDLLHGWYFGSDTWYSPPDLVFRYKSWMDLLLPSLPFIAANVWTYLYELVVVVLLPCVDGCQLIVNLMSNQGINLIIWLIPILTCHLFQIPCYHLIEICRFWQCYFFLWTFYIFYNCSSYS